MAGPDQSPSAKADSELMSRLDELEAKQDPDRSTLVARIAILEGHHSSANDGMTVSDLQESAVQRFDAISRNLIGAAVDWVSDQSAGGASSSHSKRARTAIMPLPKGFITFGPIAESAETNLRLFELHLRTAIPRFTLQGPYDVRRDPIYSWHSLRRVTVTDESAARALVEAWMQHSVEGYANIKMVQMADATGNTSVNLHSSAPNRGIDRNSNPAQNANRSQRHSKPSRR
ncbi:hypothetical protein B0H13DRAFT_1879224 [Mycena leptocephala]|nr:hypothetical protein B0H13DRAFT_1879224 [Mycena leptocephala]